MKYDTAMDIIITTQQRESRLQDLHGATAPDSNFKLRRRSWVTGATLLLNNDPEGYMVLPDGAKVLLGVEDRLDTTDWELTIN